MRGADVDFRLDGLHGWGREPERSDPVATTIVRFAGPALRSGIVDAIERTR